MNFAEHYFNEDNARAFASEVMPLIEQEAASIGIDPAFTTGLANYLEKRFPTYGDFDVAIGNEIRKYMKGDNSYVKKVKKRIHEIIQKCKNRFLHDITNKVEKIKVQPKADPQAPPPLDAQDPLMSDEPTQGDTPPHVSN